MIEELHQFLRSGADLVITKPMKPALLNQILRMMVAKGSKSEFPEKHLIVEEDDDFVVHWGPMRFS